MKQRGQTLVATLIVIAIIAILVVVVMGRPGGPGATGSPRADGKGSTALGLTKLAAQDDVCRSNLQQCRLGIQVQQSANDDQNPASLDDLKIGAQFYSCPVGKERYEYNPEDGKVKCPHPGHEKY